MLKKKKKKNSMVSIYHLLDKGACSRLRHSSCKGSFHSMRKDSVI